jgi:hypothetical protein
MSWLEKLKHRRSTHLQTSPTQLRLLGRTSLRTCLCNRHNTKVVLLSSAVASAGPWQPSLAIISCCPANNAQRVLYWTCEKFNAYLAQSAATPAWVTALFFTAGNGVWVGWQPLDYRCRRSNQSANSAVTIPTTHGATISVSNPGWANQPTNVPNIEIIWLNRTTDSLNVIVSTQQAFKAFEPLVQRWAVWKLFTQYAKEPDES